MTNERQHDDLIDLGAASIETKGPTFGKDDVLAGQIPRELTPIVFWGPRPGAGGGPRAHSSGLGHASSASA